LPWVGGPPFPWRGGRFRYLKGWPKIVGRNCWKNCWKVVLIFKGGGDIGFRGLPVILGFLREG